MIVTIRLSLWFGTAWSATCLYCHPC